MMNNEKKYQALFDIYYQKVYSIAFYMTKDPYLAEDIAQETFIKAFQSMKHLKREDKFGGWIKTITVRTALDYLMKEKKRNDFTVETQKIDYLNTYNKLDSIVEKIIMDKETKEIMRREMERLTPTDRKIFILKYIYDSKYEEIALTLDMTVGAVKSRHIRAKNKLRKLLDRYWKDT